MCINVLALRIGVVEYLMLVRHQYESLHASQTIEEYVTSHPKAHQKHLLRHEQDLKVFGLRQLEA